MDSFRSQRMGSRFLLAVSTHKKIPLSWHPKFSLANDSEYYALDFTMFFRLLPPNVDCANLFSHTLFYRQIMSNSMLVNRTVGFVLVHEKRKLVRRFITRDLNPKPIHESMRQNPIACSTFRSRVPTESNKRRNSTASRSLYLPAVRFVFALRKWFFPCCWFDIWQIWFVQRIHIVHCCSSWHARTSTRI